MVMGKSNINESLFETEQEALRTSMADITNEHYRGNELLPGYRSMVDHYQKLLKITQKVFHISDRQGQVLQRQQNELQNLLDNANQGFLTFGRDLKVDRKYSAECARIFGRKIAGIPITKLLGQESEIFEQALREILERIFLCRKGFEQEALLPFPSGFRIGDKNIRVECKLIAQADEVAERSLAMMIITDITEQLRAEEKIRFLSYHDKLTSLHNRAHVEAVLPDLEKVEALPLSIIMLDMNGLKLVNDVFGHQQGDLLLVSMARVLMESCRQTDIIARWGGDEFLILLPKTDEYSCRKVCERIRAVCAQMVDSAIPLSAAIGMATVDSGVVCLKEMFNVAENRMYHDKLIKSREVRKCIIEGLEETLQNRCFENEGHGERVRELAADFIAFLGLAPDSAELKPLAKLTTFHDIGKVAIPRELLGKAGPLTASEWEIVKSHSDIGYRMAQSIGEMAVADIILALHERWDGTGYPYALQGDQIPLLARIFSLVDVYDTITHERPYKVAIDKKAALREIELGSGTYFDPELACCFINYMTEK